MPETSRPPKPEITLDDMLEQAERYEAEASRLLARAEDLKHIVQRAQEAMADDQ